MYVVSPRIDEDHAGKHYREFRAHQRSRTIVGTLPNVRTAGGFIAETGSLTDWLKSSEGRFAFSSKAASLARQNQLRFEPKIRTFPGHAPEPHFGAEVLYGRVDHLFGERQLVVVKSVLSLFEESQALLGIGDVSFAIAECLESWKDLCLSQCCGIIILSEPMTHDQKTCLFAVRQLSPDSLTVATIATAAAINKDGDEGHWMLMCKQQ